MEMREENKSGGTEINEAALEGVSGGYGDPHTAVGHLCPYCRDGISLGYLRCTGSPAQLEQYLNEHGLDSVRHIQECPFRKRA